MTTIKVSTSCHHWDWLRQTPNNDGLWDTHHFIFNKKINSASYWIVYDDLSVKETSLCPPHNTILVMAEPSTIKKYHPKFLAQFNHIITTHTNIKHPGIISKHPHLPWMIGYQPPKKEFKRSYSELQKIKDIPKTKLLSVMASDKQRIKGHKKRLKFVKKLQQHFGSQIDFFGRGINTIQDKWDAIAPYKYHIALENTLEDHYWTEKLSDAYLAHSYPIYYGCPNISNYFPKESYAQIDINNHKKAIQKIEQVIRNDIYEKNLPFIKQAKKLVLDKYNFFPEIVFFCKSTNFAKQNITLYPDEYFYKHDPLYKKALRKTKYMIFKQW